jgi:hypothetical protein
MLVSVIYASLTPEQIARNLAMLQGALGSVPYEVLVATTAAGAEVARAFPEARTLVEETPAGSAQAQARAWQAAKGDVALTITDDKYVFPGALATLVAFCVARAEHVFPYVCAPLMYDPHFQCPTLGTAFGRLYPRLMCARRDTLAAIGGLFDPAYVSSYVDCDLGLRVWEAGGRCEVCVEATYAHMVARVRRRTTRDPDNQRRDFERFMSRWCATGIGAPLLADRRARGRAVANGEVFINVPAPFFPVFLREIGRAHV